MQAELRVSSGRQTGSVISLTAGKFLIGREEDCHLRPNSDLVSRHHCVFTTDADGVRLRDLGSTNGTLVNGEKIRGAVQLQDGDRVSVGKLDFEVVLRDPAREDTSLNMSQETQTSLPAGTVVDPSGTIPAEPDTSATMMDLPVTAGAPTGDTAFGQPAMPPMYGQPLGYPQYMPQMPQYGYPPPGYPMPGYYPQQMPMGYPMGGYPGMQPMQMPMAAPAQPAPVEEPTKPSSGLEVKLPEPENTGAKAPEPPKPVAPDASGAPKKANIPDTAADIIKQYRTRRPNTGG
jgi:pSer/pThr/pTyr-binding forkhead associated (FHA) protein